MLPYRRVASLLRLTQSADFSPASIADRGTGRGHRDADARGGRDAAAIGWAVQGAAARTPWPSTCLVQSLAGYVMLRRHGVPSVVYLGVAKDAAGEFIAHSWLRCGDRTVTGGGSQQRYSAIAAYRSAPGRHG
jgi:Transglutaminase-like superfamily